MLSQPIYVLSIMINSQNDELPYHETVKVQVSLCISFYSTDYRSQTQNN